MTAPKIRFKEFSENWGSKKIIELADYVDYRGKTPKKVESGVLLVTAKNIKQGYLDYSASQEFIEESAFDDVMRRGKVELNDVLITTEAPLGNVASVDRTDIALAQRVIKYRGKTGLLDNLFLKQKFLSESFQEILKSKATGGTVQGIKGSVLHQIPLIVPSKEEQTKIASFLSAVDEKISQLTQKHQLLSQYKQGMMQKLFSQQIRFKADDGSEFRAWEKSKLNKYINEIKENSKTQDEYEVLTSSRRGLIRQAEYFEGSRLSDRDNIGFNIIHPNQITYRSRSDDGLFFFNLNNLGITGIISTYYPVFTMNNGDTRFLAEYLNFHKQEYIKYAVGTSQLVLSINELKNMKFYIPCLEEQTKIANFLSSIDQKIDLVSNQLEQAKLWKKGLLQQMFV